MQSTSIVFCVLVIAGCKEVRIHGAVEPTSTTEENTKFNGTKQAFSEPVDKNFIEWFLQILGQRPTSTTAPFADTENPNVCPPCKCGLTNTQRRIVGGVETKRNQYPWMAQMLRRGNFYCGATVINSGYVVTAAHCIDRIDKAELTVRIGDHDRSSNTEAKTIDFKVDDTIRHSGYSTENYNNDIALVKLRGAINFVGPMRPVCLPERGLTYAGKIAIVTGWGAVQESGPTSNTLLEVSVPIMTNNECRSMRYPARRITDNMMCAGYTQGGKDSCQGDSGGPLHVVDDDKVHRLAGVVSWGEGCALSGYPGVYTRVNRYLTWLESNTVGACYCD